MTHQCSNCEIEFKGPQDKCSNCRGNKPMAISAKNFKWKVAIEVCPVGHRYVPLKGQCGVCTPVILDARGCEQCKRSMVGLGNRRFCSTACSQAHTLGVLTDRECKHCEAKLYVKQEKFCSNPCALAYARNIRRLLNTPMI